MDGIKPDDYLTQDIIESIAYKKAKALFKK